MGVDRFEDLVAWQRARVLTRGIYAATQSGTFAKDFGLAGQIQRASVSVMSNIAAGFERNRPAEFHQALSTAKASCAEVRSLLYVGLDVGYLSDEKFQQLMDEAASTAQITGALRAAVERRKNSAAPTRGRQNVPSSASPANGDAALSTQHHESTVSVSPDRSSVLTALGPAAWRCVSGWGGGRRRGCRGPGGRGPWRGEG